jgi:O-antigen chain-terminating methyltransferase
VLDLVAGLRADLEAMRRDARADLEALQGDMAKADAGLAERVEESRDFVRIGASRADALAAALDQKIETLAVRLRDLSTPLLTTTGSSVASDFLYRRLEDGLRGSEQEIAAAVAPYVELAKAHQPAIDAGCGRGEFLAACGKAGIEARGFDTNERSVADLKARGFDVAIDRIPHCFESLPDGSVGSILAMHVVEHLPVDDLFALFAQSARVLRPGGLLMIETPNAESLLVTGSEFWRDPTHLAPRHPAALTLLAREHGFSIQTVRAIHPFPEGTRLAASDDDPASLRRTIAAINDRLFGPQDLMLVARKG